jgi:hypothetical protein
MPGGVLAGSLMTIRWRENRAERADWEGTGHIAVARPPNGRPEE